MQGIIDTKIIINRKINNVIKVYIMTLIITILSMIIIFLNYKIKLCYKTVGIVEINDNNFYVIVKVPIEKMEYVINNNYLYIDRKKYQYEIKELSLSLINEEETSYQIVKIFLELDDIYKINNLVINLKFLGKDRYIFDYLKRMVNNE